MAITQGSKILAADFIASSAGAGDAAKGVKLGADGKVDETMQHAPNGKLFTLGEAVASVAPPVAVYLKAADGKVYKTDAAAADEKNSSFVGFAIQTGNANDSKLIITTGVLAGFSGLTAGTDYFLTNTAGTISATPGNVRKKIGKAVSASEILLQNDEAGVYSPSGAVIPYAGSSAPTGWLIADGASLLRANYPALFAIIGTTYGSADGSHFTLPNLKGKIPVGVSSTETEFDTLGETGGEKTHELTVAELASHRHTIPCVLSAQQAGAAGASVAYITGSGEYTGYSGSGTAHNNIQPYIALNYIIKY